MKRWCKCGRKIPTKDTYCENCNILFYNLKKKEIKVEDKNQRYNTMQEEEKVEESTEVAEEEVATEAAPQ